MKHPAIITDVDRWLRVGRGRVISFFATDTELQNWIAHCLPDEYGPYQLVGADKIKEGKRYRDQPFFCEPAELLHCVQESAQQRWQFWIWSPVLTPDLKSHLRTVEWVDALCSKNGLINIQYGLAYKGRRRESSLGLVDKVGHVETWEVREYAGYLEIFQALRKEIEKALCYATIIRFPDGHEEEDDRGVRMTQAAAQAYREGCLFERAPGRLLERSRRSRAR